MVRCGRNIEGARGLRWRGTEEEGALARPERPRRCTLPMTALRVIPPSSPAIWLAERPSAHSFLRSSTRSSVQVCNSGRFWSKNVIGLCSTLLCGRLPRAESPAYARRHLAAARTLYLVGTNSGDTPPHEMSYLIVIKLQYTVTPAQESEFTGCTAILCFPQQCPFWRPEAASLWQCTHVDRSPRRTYNPAQVPPGEAAHFISGLADENVP